jgi:hypothetical protein
LIIECQFSIREPEKLLRNLNRRVAATWREICAPGPTLSLSNGAEAPEKQS